MPSELIREKKNLPRVAGISIILLFFLAIFTLFHIANKPSDCKVLLTAYTSAPETAQVFYRSDFNGYTQGSSRTITLEPGLHEHTFRISPPYHISKIRLDPARQVTEMRIERFVFEWDGRVVIDLQGDSLLTSLVPLSDVTLGPAEGDNGILLYSQGVDPVLEVDVGRFTFGTRVAVLAKSAGKAALATLLFMIPFLYLTSRRYLTTAHYSFPAANAHWLCWGGLFFATGIFLTIVTPVALGPKSPQLQFWASAYSLGAVLFLPGFWLCTREMVYSESSPPARFNWLWYAIPSLVLWPFILLSFWPGSMSPDSFDQWRQVVNFSFKDWHPVFHTLNIWLVTRIVLSPAVVAIAQILALALSAGWTLSVFERYGVPRAVLWITSSIFAISPVNGLIAVTLWKDVAFSISLLILAMYVFLIVMQKGEWLRSRKNILLLGLVVAFVSLYRHNGVAPAVFTCVLLLFSFRHCWKEIVAASLIALLLYAGVKGPLYDALEVKRGNPLNKVEKKLKKTFTALLKNDESPRVTLVEPEHVERHGSKKSEDGLEKALTDRLYSASRLWRIQPLTGFHRRIEYVNLWEERKGDQLKIRYVNSNKYGIEENSLIPKGRDLLYRLFNQSRYGGTLFWVWRPAVYFYLLIGGLALMSYRFRNRLYLLLAPSVANSLPIFLIIIHKSIFRYHYPVVLLGTLVILPLLFMKPVHGWAQEQEQTT